MEEYNPIKDAIVAKDIVDFWEQATDKALILMLGKNKDDKFVKYAMEISSEEFKEAGVRIHTLKTVCGYE